MNATKQQMSFVVDSDTLDLIRDLKKELGASTTSGVLRKSLVLAKVAVEEARATNGIITLKGRGTDDSAGVSIALKA